MTKPKTAKQDPRTIAVFVDDETNARIHAIAARRGMSPTRAMRLVAERAANDAGEPRHFKVPTEVKAALLSLSARTGETLDEIFADAAERVAAEPDVAP